MNPIKRALSRHTPSLYRTLASINFFLKCRRTLGPCQRLVERTVFPDGNIRVLGGPFEGMAYYNKTIWGTITSKWLGCYEEEIQPVIDEIIRTGYPVIVDVGAAEGYYAVGLAKRLPGSRVITYDIDPIARIRQKQLAELNDIRNLEVRELCSHSDFDSIPTKGTVVICDIEGFELELLDPEKCPSLEKMDILVENHHFKGNDVSTVAAAIEARFSSTHAITRFTNGKRDRDAARRRIPSLSNMSDADLDFALDEGRYPGQIWLWMKHRLE